jgi:hypothetical protein
MVYIVQNLELAMPGPDTARKYWDMGGEFSRYLRYHLHPSIHGWPNSTHHVIQKR